MASELWLVVSSSLPLKVPQSAGWVEGFENPGGSTLENMVIWDLGRLTVSCQIVPSNKPAKR